MLSASVLVVLAALSLQERIDRTSAAGGGRVVVRGDNVVAGLELKSGVELHLEKDARILAATNLEDYAEMQKRAGQFASVFAMGATNVAITGEGTIDGRGDCFDRLISRNPFKLRKGWHGVLFRNCRGVRVEDVTMRGSTAWTCFLMDCTDCTVRRLTIRSHASFNNDGLDIQASNVLVEDCDIDSEDDAIVLKANHPKAKTEHVRVRRCRLSTNSNYLKIGTETAGRFRDIVIEDCDLVCRTPIRYRHPYLHVPGVKGIQNAQYGIDIGLNDGGSVEGVVLRNIRMGDGVNTPIRVYHKSRSPNKTGEPSFIRNILLENVTMSCPATSYRSCYVYGKRDLPVEDVTFRNVELLFRGGGTAEDAAKTYDDSDPLGSQQNIYPASVFYLRHAKNVRFENVRARILGADARPPVVIDEDEGVVFEGCDFSVPDSCVSRDAIVRRPLR